MAMLACESVSFEKTLKGQTEIVLEAGVPTTWVDVDGEKRTVVPACSMVVSKHKPNCSIVVYGQVLVTGTEKNLIIFTESLFTSILCGTVKHKHTNFS